MDNITYGKSIPARQQRFSTKDAGRMDFVSKVTMPNNIPASFNPELLKNPQKQNSIFVGDPMSLQRRFMVAPCKEDDVSAQMFAQSSNKMSNLFTSAYTAIPVNPLSSFGINLHDRLGAFGLADFSQKPFYQASSY
jgi:hypothetical protein